MFTKEKTLRYLIHSDAREPNLSGIKEFLTQQLETAVSDDGKFILSEYLERIYIYVGNEEDRRQFIATKK